jgi:hypothetical protein
MRRHWRFSFLAGIAVALGLIAVGGPGREWNGVSALASLPRVAPLELPRSNATATEQFEVVWAEGVGTAYAMYFPSELDVLEVVSSGPTKQKTIELATRLGVEISAEAAAQMPEESIMGEGCYGWQFGEVNVDVFADGNLGASWTDRELPAEYFTKPNAGSPPMITKESAIAVADTYLKSSALLPGNARVTEAVPKGAVRRLNPITGQEEVVALAWSVIYRRFWSGIPEGRLGVWVTGKGEIFSLSRNMRDVRSLGKYPLLSPEEARESIWSPTSRVETSSTTPGYRPVRVVVEKVVLAYYDGATAWRLQTIHPCYIFTGTGWDAEGRPQGFTAMVPAIRPEYLNPT